MTERINMSVGLTLRQLEVVEPILRLRIEAAYEQDDLYDANDLAVLERAHATIEAYVREGRRHAEARRHDQALAVGLS